MKKIISLTLGLVLALHGALVSQADTLNVHDLLSRSDSLTIIAGLSDTDKNSISDYLLTSGFPSDLDPAIVFNQLSRSRAASSFGFNAAEGVGCVIVASVGDCITANNDAITASNTAIGLYPNSPMDSFQDAMRHCHWSSLMSIHMSTSLALKIAANHEQYNPGTPDQTAMDYFNNAWGRYTRTLTTSIFAGRAYCITWTNDGTLARLQ